MSTIQNPILTGFNFVVTAPAIEGPWSEPVYLHLRGDEAYGCELVLTHCRKGVMTEQLHWGHPLQVFPRTYMRLEIGMEIAQFKFARGQENWCSVGAPFAPLFHPSEIIGPLEPEISTRLICWSRLSGASALITILCVRRSLWKTGQGL